MRQTILVTGSTGLIGKELIKVLTEKNHNVVALYHHATPEQTRGIVPVCHDLTSNVQDLKSPMRSATTVIHLAWDFTTTTKDNFQLLNSPNYIMLKNVYTAATDVGVKKIIFVSGMNASTFSLTPFLQEKYLCERLLVQSKKSLERVIIRAPLLEASEQHQLYRSVLNSMRWPGFYPIPQAKASLVFGLVQDVVKEIIESLAVSAYNVTVRTVHSDYRTSVHELFKTIATKSSKSSKIAIGGTVGEIIFDLTEKLKIKKDQNEISPRYFIDVGREMGNFTN